MSLLIHNRIYSSLHFTGILGAGMSALAQYVRWMGCDVSGSDRALGKEETEDISEYLTSIGCRLFSQDGSGIDEKCSGIVISSAIEENNPEILRARQLNVPVYHRSDVLAAIIQTKKAVAVAGTSGKSTVTAMIFHLLQSCGQNPSLITGAGLNSLQKLGMPGNAFYGEGHWLVVEADESDGSLIKYHPYIALVLNVSKDHKTIQETLQLFSTLADQSEIVLKNSDDPLLDSIDATYCFGQSPVADYTVESLESTAQQSAFSYRGTSFSTPMPGRHNAINLFAAVVASLLCGCSPECLRDAAKKFPGLHRRFTITQAAHGITIIDDYAHNAEKIRAAVTAAQALSPRVFVLFQPHGFGPMRFMREELAAMFRQTLRENDSLYLLPIYYAGGNVMRDISSADLASDLQESSFAVHAPSSREKAVEAILRQVRPKEVILSMGARDPSLDAFAQWIARQVEEISL
ncbi:MAG: UDP-N-acetylmuramate--L-alanine ligase [Fibrobacterota bacterium]